MLIHVVKSRETLWQISAFYRVPISRIVNVNQLPDPNKLLIGQALVIPTEDVFYNVKAGDTLWKIAQAHGTTIQAIIRDIYYLDL
jgi:spore germination protein